MTKTGISLASAKKKHLRHFRGEDQLLSCEYGRYPAGWSSSTSECSCNFSLLSIEFVRMPA
jgi:hypothetical protein